MDKETEALLPKGLTKGEIERFDRVNSSTVRNQVSNLDPNAGLLERITADGKVLYWGPEGLRQMDLEDVGYVYDPSRDRYIPGQTIFQRLYH